MHHAAMMEHPDEFNRLLEEWLTKTNFSLFESLHQYKIYENNIAEFIISNSDVSKCPKDFYLNMLL
jgi:hypothetical protein